MKRTEYTDEPMQIGQEVHILPPPAELAKMVRTVRTTLTLTEETLDFFKIQAKEMGVPYNGLIRKALDEYVRINHPL